MSTSYSIARLPRPAASHAGLPVGSLDVLPRLAAATWPARTALLGPAGPVTFAGLDRRISRLASGIRELLGGEDSVVAVSAVPGVDFAVAYYAVVRSGNVVAPVNPRLGAEVLDRLLVSVGARAAVLDRAMHDRVRPALPRLEQVLLLDGAAGGPLTCAELAGRGDLLVEPRDRDENETGVIRLGPGTAGYPKAAAVSHHGVKVAAAQTVAEHGLSANSVALYALPGYHAGHLDAAVLAGATQVFCASQDPVVLAGRAEAHGATHCYPPGEARPVRPSRAAVAS